MPPTPPIIPKNLQSTLSSIRSGVFLSIHNPTNARLGNKYLRKALKGPAMLEYYPKSIPKPATLDKIFNDHMQESEKRYLENGGSVQDLEDWKKNQQIAPKWQPVPKLPQARDHTGVYWDAREDDRLAFVEKRRAIGKGPPKKKTEKAAVDPKKRKR